MVQAYIAAGFPKRWAFAQLPNVDDVDYILDLVEREKEDAIDFYQDNPMMANLNKQDNEQPDDNEDDKPEEDGKKEKDKIVEK